MQTEIFQNSFEDWAETHYEIVSFMVNDTFDDNLNMVNHISEYKGHGGLYEKSIELTNKFEEKYAYEEWENKGWLETLEEFYKQEEKKYLKNLK